jgi:hypothetical protein
MAEDQMDTFKWSILALVQPADVQRTLLPDFVPVGDELALTFGDGLLTVDRQGITERQQSAIEALDQRIVSLSGEDNAAFWLLEERLRCDPQWDEIRSLAKAVADAFGWPIVAPPADRGVVIRADNESE